MVRGLVVVSCLAACTPGVPSCPEGKYPSASGDCEEKQDGGSQYSGDGSGGGGDDTAWGGDDTAWGGDDTGGGGGAPEVNVDQNESGVRLTVQPGGYYYFGLAETGSGSSDPWTGEDCYYGYTTSDGSYYQYCHTVDGDGLILQQASSLDEMDYDRTFFGNVSESATTYVLIDYSTYACYTWGHDTSYYSYLGCIDI